MQNYQISTKNKVKIGFLAGIYILAVLIFLTVFFEGLGSFVGVLLDRPVAENYINKNYSGLEYKYVSGKLVNEEITQLGVKSTVKTYRFTFEALDVTNSNTGNLKAGDTFYIDAYNFVVNNDTIYMDYNCDNNLLEEVNGKFLSELIAFCESDEEIKFTAFDAYIDIKPAINEFEDVLDVLASSKIKNCDAVIHVLGDKIDFDTYKGVIAPLVKFYEQTEDIVRPKNLQIFYYYTNESGEKVMAFESQMTDFDANEVLYTVENIATSKKNIHYKVELNESDSKKLTAYETVKTIYTIFLGATITVLYTYFTVKRIRKLVKMGNTL